MNTVNLLKPPPASMTALESRALLDVCRMSVPLARLIFKKSEPWRKQRVLVVPGFGADDRYTWPLRNFVRAQGYATTGWGLGTNKAGLNMPHQLTDVHPRWNLKSKTPYRGEGGVPYVIDRFIEKFDELASADPKPIALIGWSLGGFMAREVARERPNQVSQVITLGSPVIGGPKYTLAAAAFIRRKYDLDWIEQSITEREDRPITVPITAIVSQSDGIVGYPAAIDHHSPSVQHLHMDVAHLSFPYNTRVWSAIASALNSLEGEKARV